MAICTKSLKKFLSFDPIAKHLFYKNLPWHKDFSVKMSVAVLVTHMKKKWY